MTEIDFQTPIKSTQRSLVGNRISWSDEDSEEQLPPRHKKDSKDIPNKNIQWQEQEDDFARSNVSLSPTPTIYPLNWTNMWQLGQYFPPPVFVPPAHTLNLTSLPLLEQEWNTVSQSNLRRQHKNRGQPKDNKPQIPPQSSLAKNTPQKKNSNSNKSLNAPVTSPPKTVKSPSIIVEPIPVLSIVPNIIPSTIAPLDIVQDQSIPIVSLSQEIPFAPQPALAPPILPQLIWTCERYPAIQILESLNEKQPSPPERNKESPERNKQDKIENETTQVIHGVEIELLKTPTEGWETKTRKEKKSQTHESKDKHLIFDFSTQETIVAAATTEILGTVVFRNQTHARILYGLKSWSGGIHWPRRNILYNIEGQLSQENRKINYPLLFYVDTTYILKMEIQGFNKQGNLIQSTGSCMIYPKPRSTNESLTAKMLVKFEESNTSLFISKKKIAVEIQLFDAFSYDKDLFKHSNQWWFADIWIAHLQSEEEFQWSVLVTCDIYS